MINLKEYYLNSINSANYYNRFYESINLVNDKFTILDDMDAIEQFKELIQPGVEKKLSYVDNIHFLLLCFYLKSNGYQIEQFPKLLSNPKSLESFGYDDIREYIGGSPVAWSDRRQLIKKLNFVKEVYTIPYQFNEEIKMISTRNASFEQMEPDEKLEMLCNLIEYLLKENGQFISIFDNSIFQILDDDKIKKYRNKLECFRHSLKVSLSERSKYSNFEKDFLIRYGIFIVETIYKKIN